MGEVEQVSFKIISAVGTARACYIEAIQESRKGNYEKAEQLIEDGRKAFALGHEAHFELVTKSSEGININLDLLLVHAEDQLMSAESFGILAKEFIETYKLILNK